MSAATKLPESAPITLPLEEMDDTNRNIGTGIFPLDAISERPGHNPRTDYGEADGSFAALVDSIRQFGVLQAPIIIPTSTAQDAWFVVSGHRRIAAARAAGLKELRCLELAWEWTTGEDGADLARGTLLGYTEAEQGVYALIENLQRKELNCIEVADGIVRLEKLGKTQEEIGRWIGRGQSWVSKCVRLLSLPGDVTTLLRDGGLTQSHGEELLPLLGESFLPGEIVKLAYQTMEQSLTVAGLRNVVREKIERTKPVQTTIDDYATSNNAEPTYTPEEQEQDARIARTLAATKGLDKEPAPAPAHKDTNGLTRKDSDAQFAAAMAPDPDVIPLSERPGGEKPKAELPSSAKGTFFFLPADAAQLLFELSDWHRQEQGDLITADQKLEDIVRSFHQAKLEMRVEAEKAKAAREVTFPVFEPTPAQEELSPSLEDDAFLSAFWRCLANHGHEKRLLAFTLPTTRGTSRRFAEMLGEALGEAGGWGSPGTFGWVSGEQKGGPYPSVKLTYREDDRSREFTFKSGEFLDMAEKAIAWKHAEMAKEDDEPITPTTDLYDAPQGLSESADKFAGALV